MSVNFWSISVNTRINFWSISLNTWVNFWSISVKTRGNFWSFSVNIRVNFWSINVNTRVNFKLFNSYCMHAYKKKNTPEIYYKTILIEKFEDTKGVIRIRISKKNRQHNGPKKSTKWQTTIYKTYIGNALCIQMFDFTFLWSDNERQWQFLHNSYPHNSSVLRMVMLFKISLPKQNQSNYKISNAY